MKKILLPALCLVLISTACRKQRTCTCNSTSTNNYSTTYNNSSFTNSSGTSVNTDTDKIVVEKIKKKDMNQLFDCNSRTTKSSSTYTYAVTGTVVATNKNDYTTDYTCTLD